MWNRWTLNIACASACTVVIVACAPSDPLVAPQSALRWGVHPPKEWAAAARVSAAEPLVSRTNPEDRWSVFFHLSDGQQRWSLTPGQLEAKDYMATPHSAWLPVHDAGTLDVTVQLQPIGGAAEPVRAELRLPLRTDVAWLINADLQLVDPRQSCIGCDGSRAFPLRTRRPSAQQDSLWITWAAQPISSSGESVP